MLDALAANDPDGVVTAICGDMVDDLPAGPFDLVLVAYNTLFNLLDVTRQARCLAEAARRLDRGGVLVVEAFVPDDQGRSRRDDVGLRSMTATEVVLSVSRTDPAGQRVEGQYVTITESGGVRLRPWAIRWSTPAQLDEMAARAGLERIARWASLTAAPFDEGSARHVSVYAATGVTAETSGRVRNLLG